MEIKRFKIPICEVFLSGVSVWWAIVLLMNQTLLDTGLPLYFEAVNKLDEMTWAIVFLVSAGIKVVGLITMKTWMRKVGLICSMVLYSIICTGYILSGNIFFTGTGVYFLVTVLAWWGFREVKEYAEQ